MSSLTYDGLETSQPAEGGEFLSQEYGGENRRDDHGERAEGSLGTEFNRREHKGHKF